MLIFPGTLPTTLRAAAIVFAMATGGAISQAHPTPTTVADLPNADAVETPCEPEHEPARSGGLVGIAPDGTGATARERTCVVLSGVRRAAQIARTIEVKDAGKGPPSGPGISTAANGSYALSLVNVRPEWARSGITGEADGLSVWIRQAHGDTAAMLANVGVRNGFATTLESYTFAADEAGRPLRAVRTQLGVVNPRDGGEYGLVLQAADGNGLSAGLRIASIGPATWKNYLEVVDPAGVDVAKIRGADGAFVGGDLLPGSDLSRSIGSPGARYLATNTQVLALAPARFADLPRCGGNAGGGMIAFVTDAPRTTGARKSIRAGGGTRPTFVKCDGTEWTAF